MSSSSQRSENRRLRSRIDDLEQEIVLLRDRSRQRVLDQPYPPKRGGGGPAPQRPTFQETFLESYRKRAESESGGMQNVNPLTGEPERALPALDPQPKQGWLRSIWRATLGLFE